MRRSHSRLVLLLVLLAANALAVPLAGYGDGHSGDVVITAANTVVNTPVTRLIAAVASGTTSVPVVSSAGFTVGDLVMLHVSLGWGSDTTHAATINMSLSNTGEYAFVRVLGIPNGTTLTVSPLPISFQTGDVQLLRVPEYSSLRINFGGSIVAQPYSTATQTGGIVAFFVNGDFVNGGSVHANAAGYPGSGSSANGVGNHTDQAPSLNPVAEGFAGLQGASMTTQPTTWARGRWFTGGGGGACHNAGGGGGGHVGAGGTGGNTSLAYAPFPGNPYGGQGGAAMLNLGDRLMMGGGGGEGHKNDGKPTTGGAGGGIVYIQALRVPPTTLIGIIEANGAPGQPQSFAGMPSDGAGGGGAGGHLYLNLGRFLTCSSTNARGGVGGRTWADPLSPGAGGGGGGGLYETTGPNFFSTCGASVSSGAGGTNVALDGGTTRDVDGGLLWAGLAGGSGSFNEHYVTPTLPYPVIRMFTGSPVLQVAGTTDPNTFVRVEVANDAGYFNSIATTVNGTNFTMVNTLVNPGSYLLRSYAWNAQGVFSPLSPAVPISILWVDAGALADSGIDAGQPSGSSDGGRADAGPSDAGVDASVADAGGADAGAPDASVADSGAADAGFTDAGQTLPGEDAGASDAGAADGGAADAGDSADAGADPLELQVGCNCTEGPHVPLWSLGVLLLTLYRRRRH